MTTEANDLDTLTIPEAAIPLRCHPVTLRRLIASGRGPRTIRVGSALRIRCVDLAEWMNQGGAVKPEQPRAM